MQPTLQIADETGLLLALWPDGTVQVPQDAEERARCYDQLSGALALLVDTVSSQRLSDVGHQSRKAHIHACHEYSRGA